MAWVSSSEKYDAGHSILVILDQSALMLLQPVDAAHQRRFPGAGGTANHHAITFGYGEMPPLQEISDASRRKALLEEASGCGQFCSWAEAACGAVAHHGSF